MSYNVINVIAYEICLWLIRRRQSFRLHPLVQRVMEHCFQDWVLWKTDLTMKDVDKQVEELKEQWDRDEAEKSVEKFSEIFPDAEVTPHEKNGAVRIEHPADGSRAQDLLGGAMEIKSPWSGKRK